MNRTCPIKSSNSADLMHRRLVSHQKLQTQRDHHRRFLNYVKPLCRSVIHRTVCKAHCLHEWQRVFTQFAKTSVFMSGEEASHSVQGPVSSLVAENLHTVCKAQCLHEWRRGFTQCARLSVFMSGGEASHSLKNACAGLSRLEISGDSLRVPNLVWRHFSGISYLLCRDDRSGSGRQVEMIDEPKR